MGFSPLGYVLSFTGSTLQAKEGNHNEGSCLSKEDL